MRAEIITIGDELLIGQVIDTNSPFIATKLNETGIEVHQISSVQDDESHILQALREAGKRAEIIILTGGLGPTKDDITKKTLCTFFDDHLVKNEEIVEHIEALFKRFVKTPVSEVNRRQALLPSKAEILKNHFGTASGMWFNKNGKVYISLPGVPLEMQNLITDQVIPRLQKKFSGNFIVHKTVLTHGMGESAVARRIEAWEKALPPYIKLAYLPSFSKVRLRLSARGTDKALLVKNLDQQIAKLRLLIDDIIYGVDTGDSLEKTIGVTLKNQGKTLAVAESCTGGAIAALISSVPGASAYFKGAAVTYATHSKTDILGVSPTTIKKHSVVSEAVAKQMAAGVRKVFKTDFALATTGNAGPKKGDSPTDVGTVFIALASENEIICRKLKLGRHRERVIGKAKVEALEMLLKKLNTIEVN